MAELQKFRTYVEKGLSTLIPQVSTWVNSYALTANTAKSISVPSGATLCIISSDVDIWVASEGTAVVPVSDTTDGTGVVLNPGARSIPAGVTTLSVISEYAAKVSIEWYK